MITEHVRIETNDGIAIEASFDVDNPARASAILCHAHPKMGGTMNAPLLLAVRDELVRRRWAVVRFNFRGVGSSEGESSIGFDESEDAAAAVAYARERLPDAPVALTGWSFGGGVAIRAIAADAEIAACVAIAPAVTERPGLTAGLEPGRDLRLSQPVLVICGSNDVQVSPDECRAWARDVPSAHYVEVPGANHFFWARYDKLARMVGDWLDAQV
ncbi:MAG TPA: alpha/beta fold hydrolase [Actinomycetota bacterium]|nr:alpha/beta fold hydrolase [Actinomycetota bacterium]